MGRSAAGRMALGDPVHLRRVLPLTWALYGFTSLLAQVVFLREFLVVFQGNELSLGVTLALWLFGVSLGGIIWGLVSDRIKDRQTLLALLHILTAIILLELFPAARFLRPILKIEPGEAVGIGSLALGGLMVLVPLGLMLGGFFPLNNRVALGSEEVGSRFGRVYALETLGAALAGALFTFALSESVPASGIIAVLCALNFLAALAIKWFVEGAGPLWIPVSTILFLPLFFLCGYNFFSAPEQELNQVEKVWQGYKAREVSESRFGRVWVLGRGNEVSIFENGGISGHYPDPSTAEDLLFWGALQFGPGELARSHIIGGGATAASSPALKLFPKTKFTYMDRNRKLIQAVERFIPGGLDSVKSGGIIYKDPGSDWGPEFVLRPVNLIITAMPEPTTADINRFYTLDFLDHISPYLAPDGVLSVALSGSAGYLSEPRAELLAGIKKTLEQRFRQVFMIPSSYTVFLATNRSKPLIRTQAEYETRLMELGINTDFFASVLLSNLNPVRSRIFNDAIAAHSNAAVNTDDRPAAYLFEMLLEAEEQKSRTAAFLLRVRSWNWSSALWAVAGFFMVLWGLGVVLRSQRPAVIGALFATGFLEMGFEVLLLLGFQSLFGYVYGMMGVMLAAFMAGMGIGSLGARAGSIDAGATRRKMAFGSLILALDILVLFLIILFRNRWPITGMRWLVPWIFALMALGAGFAGGGIFVRGSRLLRRRSRSSSASAGIVYALDLLGSSLGALTVAVIFIPVWGLSRTAALGVEAALLMAIMLFLSGVWNSSDMKVSQQIS